MNLTGSRGNLTRKQYESEWKKDFNRRKKYPYMSQVWYPLAKKDEFPNAGGMIESPWRGVLHSTEGKSYAGARAAYTKGVAPHFTVSFEGDKFQCWQHMPIDRAAKALEHPAGTVDTNRLRCIQIEIVAYAGQIRTLKREYLSGIGKLMRWCEANTGIKRTALDFHSDREGIVLATKSSPVRLSVTDWKNFSGWCGHQHVPVNAHWDPGDIDIDYLMSVDIGVKPMIDPPLDMHRVVAIRKDPYTPNGVYILQEDGAVFAWEGAVYYGGANGQPWWTDAAGRKAARLVWPEEFTKETGQPSPYKYHIQATSGEWYGLPT